MTSNTIRAGAKMDSATRTLPMDATANAEGCARAAAVHAGPTRDDASPESTANRLPFKLQDAKRRTLREDGNIAERHAEHLVAHAARRRSCPGSTAADGSAGTNRSRETWLNIPACYASGPRIAPCAAVCQEGFASRSMRTRVLPQPANPRERPDSVAVADRFCWRATIRADPRPRATRVPHTVPGPRHVTLDD